jgi:uridine kinase
MLIGIAGPSCSGKSTVARQVADALSCTLLHLDGRWVSGALKPVVSGHRSYERPHQYDGASLLRDALEALGRNPPVVIEGFLLFCYRSPKHDQI